MLNLPWLIVSVIVYAGTVYFRSDGMSLAEFFNSELFSIPMMSGAEWSFSTGDSIMLLTLFLLGLEIIKSTRIGVVSTIDHVLSMLVFVSCLVMFLMWNQAATSLFFFITIATLIDVIGGFIISIRAARRDIGIGAGAHLPHE